MPTRPLVSIIVPCYNGEQYVGIALDSVLGQTYRSLEIIVVDDGSTDGSAEIVQQRPTVRYVCQDNSGPAAARNRGLGLAQGELIAFLDADDVWHPTMVERCVDILEAQPNTGAAHTDWVPIDAEGMTLGRTSAWQAWRGDIFERLLLHIPLNGSCIVWRKIWWQEIGGFDQTPEVNDDWINWLRIAHRGCRFECIECPLVYRRSHATSLTRAQPSRIIQWRLNALDMISREFDLSSELLTRALAEPYRLMGQALFCENRPDDAVAFLCDACERVPDLLSGLEACFALADAAGIYSQHSVTSESARMARALESELAHHMGPAERTRFLAFWRICLARRAYSTDATWSARRHILAAGATTLAAHLRLGYWGWLARILAGPRLIRSVKRLGAGLGSSAEQKRG